MVPDITVPVINTEAPTLAVRSAFDFCNNTYNFTVVANTLTGAGESSMSVVVTRPDFFSEFDSCPQENCNKAPTLHLAASEFTVSITGTVRNKIDIITHLLTLIINTGTNKHELHSIHPAQFS